MTVDQYISAAASFGTLVAAFLAFFSIREVRLQRTQQFQARLTPTGGYFVIEQRGDVLFWPTDGPANDQSLPLLNVGNGVATDVEVEWHVDVQDWVQRANNLSAQTGSPVGLRLDSFGLQVTQNGELRGGFRLPNDFPQRIDYVLPVASDAEPKRIQIPPSVIMLLQAYYWSYFNKEGDGEWVHNPSAEFQCEVLIRYKDTIAREFSRRSLITISVVLWTQETDEKPARFGYSFSPVRTEPAEGDSIAKKMLLKAASQILRSFPL